MDIRPVCGLRERQTARAGVKVHCRLVTNACIGNVELDAGRLVDAVQHIWHHACAVQVRQVLPVAQD